MSDRVYTQDEVFTAVRRLLKKYHAERAILFGSYARQKRMPLPILTSL